MRVLGIETSCDETSAALVEDGKTILFHVVFSQIDIHKKYNGVVPEIASRNHLMKMLDILDETLPGKDLSVIDAVAVTNGPGLIGSLLTGISAAKGIAYTLKKPLTGVNHIKSHMYAPHLFNEIKFPYIGLVASGGHTLLFLVKSYGEEELLGSTIDDAVGEAYDKVAKMLGLGYPGGPVIDKLAQTGDPKALEVFADMPYLFPDTARDKYLFSYSGLKTAIAYRVKKIQVTEDNIPHIASVFQNAAVEMLLRKAGNAMRDFGINRLVLSGGVAANSLLRKEFELLKKAGKEIYTAPVAYCGDNAAMVAGRGYQDLLLTGKTGYDPESLRLDAYSRLPFISKGKR